MIKDFISRKELAVEAFRNGQQAFGYRAFVDCVLDTENPHHFKKCVELRAKYEGDDQFIAKMEPEILSMLQEMSVSNIEPKQDPLVEAKKLERSYGWAKFALSGVDLTILPGEVIGLVGENGNGKTTLLRILAQELAHDNGSINYQVPVNPAYDLRTKLVYIPQRTPTWKGSLYENLKFAAAAYGVTGEMNQLLVDMMIIRFGLWDYRLLNWSELSSGYKMRFELARTFLRRPKILLLDEPLGNLDVKSQQIILEDLKGLAESPTNPIGIVLSSQQLFEVEKIADKVLFLRKGVLEYFSEKEKPLVLEKTILELEANTSILELKELLSSFNDSKISFNGGIFTIEIQEQAAFKKVLSVLSNVNFEVIYIRDISNSTRRFFI